MAESIEESDFTSAQKRAAGLKSRVGSGTAKGTGVLRAGQAGQPHSGGSMGSDDGREERRCSTAVGKNHEPLDWTARVTRSDKRGSTPKELAAVFVRLGISESVWLGLVQNFGRLFSVVAGQPQRVDEIRSKTKERRYHLRKDARELMA